MKNINTLVHEERLLVYQHVPHEHAGRFAEIAQDNGIQVDIVKFWENIRIPELKKYTRLLIMGGPQSVYGSLKNFPSRNIEVYSIKMFTQMQKPVLGICLGSQLVAYALGGNVYQNMVNGKPFKETGFYIAQLTERGKSDPLFKGFPESFKVFHWHGDVFDLPKGSTLLATGQNVHNKPSSMGLQHMGFYFI